MNGLNKIANALGNIDDRFLLEALEYTPPKKSSKRFWLLGATAAGIVLAVGVILWNHTSVNDSICVYAYESNKQLANGELVLMSGRIDDSGEMQGHPLAFYISGNEIESIRFSCRNEWISFTDWTEQRENYGFSKNFTVSYGSREDDYRYLVVDWTPQNIIRKLTDNKNININDLKQEEKEDAIVMEVTYMDGRREDTAIWIKLEDNGRFKATVKPYQITENDSLMFNQEEVHPEEGKGVIEPLHDSETKGKEADKGKAEKENEGESHIRKPWKENPTQSEKGEINLLTDEELAWVQSVIEEYYSSINLKITGFVMADETSPFMQEYEGYEADEVVLFDVFVEDNEIKRHITVGSKDDWVTCKILNEGY